MLHHCSHILNSITKKFIGQKRLRLLIAYWPQFAGEEAARHTFIKKLTPYKKNGQSQQWHLMVQVTASMAAELSYDIPNIIARINEFLGESYIGKISLQQGLNEPHTSIVRKSPPAAKTKQASFVTKTYETLSPELNASLTRLQSALTAKHDQ